MKRGIIFALILAGAVMLTACGGPKVAEEDAKKIAVKDAGQDYSNVNFTSTSMEIKNGVTKYEFTFGNDEGVWEYELDGDGNITERKETLYKKDAAAETVPETQAQTQTQAETVAVAETAAKENVAETEESKDPYFSVLYNTGETISNPSSDPYLAFSNVGVDQSDFIDEVADTEYGAFYEFDDCDLVVYGRGLSTFLTSGDSSYMQLWLNKGTTVPYKISYVDAYTDKEQFLEDFEYIEKSMEEIYGAPVTVGYHDGDGEENTFTLEELFRDLGDIDEANGGYVFVTFDTGDPAVSLNASYDAEEKIYRTFVDFE